MGLYKTEVGHAAILDITSKLKLSDLRASDVEEYSDFATKFYGVDPGRDLCTKMATLLGAMNLNCRGLLVSVKGSNEPAFLATVSSTGPGLPKVLCGVAWAKADKEVGLLDRLWVLRQNVEYLIEDDEATTFRCFVKNTNTDTLTGWKTVKSMYKKQFTVEFIPMPNDSCHGYTEVRITKN